MTFGAIDGFLYAILLSQTVVIYYTYHSWNKPRPWEKETIITPIPPFFVICSNSYTRIWDRYLPSYTSMISRVIDRIWYDISRHPICTISSIEVRTPSDITHEFWVYMLANCIQEVVCETSHNSDRFLLSSTHMHLSSPDDPQFSQESLLNQMSSLPPQFWIIIARTSS